MTHFTTAGLEDHDDRQRERRERGQDYKPTMPLTPAEIRELLKNAGVVHDQHNKMLLKHSELQSEHDARLAEHDARMAEHDVRMAEHDERMDRVGRHLEVLADITDGLIRGKADRKKR